MRPLRSIWNLGALSIMTVAWLVPFRCRSEGGLSDERRQDAFITFSEGEGKGLQPGMFPGLIFCAEVAPSPQPRQCAHVGTRRLHVMIGRNWASAKKTKVSRLLSRLASTKFMLLPSGFMLDACPVACKDCSPPELNAEDFRS